MIFAGLAMENIQSLVQKIERLEFLVKTNTTISGMKFLGAKFMVMK